MRDNLPKNGAHRFECGVVNLDSNLGRGTHWVAYVKEGRTVYYFDSFGNLKPPTDLVLYVTKKKEPVKIYYNYVRYQKFNSYNCGHLCLEFLFRYGKNKAI